MKTIFRTLLMISLSSIVFAKPYGKEVENNPLLRLSEKEFSPLAQIIQEYDSQVVHRFQDGRKYSCAKYVYVDKVAVDQDDRAQFKDMEKQGKGHLYYDKSMGKGRCVDALTSVLSKTIDENSLLPDATRSRWARYAQDPRLYTRTVKRLGEGSFEKEADSAKQDKSALDKTNDALEKANRFLGALTGNKN